MGAPPQVQKLNPMKLFAEQKDEEPVPRKKKEYVPVIIDKAAFERTVGMFEKEKKEEEENERIIKKRRAEMEAQKKRLQIEKERQLVEEEQQRLEMLRIEEENKRMAVEKAERERLLREEEERKQQIPEKVDIFEQIKNTLAKIKEDEEAQRIRIE